MENEKDDIIRLILGLSNHDDRISTLQLALSQARRCIGYDSKKECNMVNFTFRNTQIDNEDGQLTVNCIDDNRKNADECDCFTALTLYLIVLDQLGHIFINPYRNTMIDKVLEKYGNDDFKDNRIVEAVKNLRNSLCHNFGLANTKYKFSLNFNSYDGIIKVPDKKFNIDWSDKSKETQTIVNVFPLCNAIEKVIKSIVEKYENGELSCVIDDVEELKTRFTLIIE